MKIAILSDIHGNLEALEAVLSDFEIQCPDSVVCLGDLIGYGPDPEAVIRRVIDYGFISLLGNHETALFKKSDRNWMNFQAKENNEVTETLLSQQSLDYCFRLSRIVLLENARFVHGCPPDSVLKYLHMLSDEEILKCLSTSEESPIFVGHTHKLALVSEHRNKVVRERLKEGVTLLDPDKKYIINAGSVGQPRDGNNKAKYILWDTVMSAIEVRALTYEVSVTAQKILQRGFPEAYAIRLR